MKLANYYIFLLIFLCSSAIFVDAKSSNRTLLLNEKSASVALGQYLSIYDLGFDSVGFNVVYNHDELFKPQTNSEVPNLGFTNHNYWIKFSVKNTNQNQVYFLEFAYPFYNILDVYIPDTAGNYAMQRVGDHFRFDTRKIKHKNFIFELPLKSNEEKTIYAYVPCNGEATSLPINLINPIALTQKNYEEQTYLGIYYGILIFALILSIFLAFSLQEKINYQYFFYIVGVGVFQFSLDGLSFEYFWPNNTWLANHIIPLAGSFAIFFLIKFTQYLLITKNHTPTLCKFLNVLAGIDGFLFICALFENPLYSFSLQALNFVAIVTNITIYIVALKVLKIGFRPAKYFFIAFQLLIIGTLTAMLKNFGLIPRVFITEYGIQIGSAIEIIFFSFALSERVKVLKDEKQEIQNRLFEQLQENNKLQIEQNIELEKKVKERTLEIQKQSHIILEKNKDITDSINYAKRIQDAMLSTAEASYFSSDNFFIFYQPRDIVSGDFYWYRQYGNEVIVAAVDCTGHGVPGALMSMIGSTFLNSIVHDMKITQPSRILKLLDESVQIALKQKFDVVSNKDGMDIALCKINTATNKLVFAGAQRPLYFVNEQVVTVHKASTHSIGGYFEDQEKAFQEIEIDFKPGNSFYICSDGYADQFGGPNHKKFMTKNFKALLETISPLSTSQKSETIKSTFFDWKAENHQIDDILVIGVTL